MHIVVIGYGDSSTPSTRFRYEQYQTLFQQSGHRLSFLFKSKIKSSKFWDSLQAADVIVNQKCLFKRHDAKRIIALNKPTYFDFDDAIWTRPGRPFGLVTQFRVNRRFYFWLKRSKGVLVANSYLADKALSIAEHVHVVPMALDTRSWKAPQVSSVPEQVTLGWNGSPNNLSLLESLEAPLEQFLVQYPNVRMKIFCGKKPTFRFPFDYYPFAPENEIAFVQSLDIGLLPLLDDDYSKGKSPIKALQYLACGVPVVGHVNQGGTSFLTDETCIEVGRNRDWLASLKTMVDNPELRKQMGLSGVKIVAQKHSLESVFKLLCKAIGC